MTVGPEHRPEIRPLTGIRGFAAGLVLMTHFFAMWNVLLPSLRFLGLLPARGFVGVDLFFILSGFILCYVYFDPKKPRLDFAEYRSFIWHRFVRIWPVHFATITLLAVLVVTAHFLSVTVSGKYPAYALLFQLTMTHGWFYIPIGTPTDPYGAWTWNYPSWSISAEWFAYLLVFPIMWQVLRRLYEQGGRSFLLAYLSIAIWAWLIMPWQISWFYGVFMITFEFATGVLLYSVFRSTSVITQKCQRFATLTFVIAVTALLVCPKDTPLFPSFLILLFPALLLGLTAETSLISKFFATPAALWLGRVSYSLYMTQAISQKILKIAFSPEHYEHSPFVVRLSLVAATFAFILAVACAFYYLVEIPTRHYLRKVLDGRIRR